MAHKKKKKKAYRFALMYRAKGKDEIITEFIKNGRKLRKKLRTFEPIKYDSVELWDGEAFGQPFYSSR